MKNYMITVDDENTPFRDVLRALEKSGAVIQSSQEVIGTAVVSIAPEKAKLLNKINGVLGVEPEREDYRAY